MAAPTGAAPAADYSLYLVTDSTPAILGNGDLPKIVEEAILGGVTIVQYREKNRETKDLITTAARLHEVTKRHNVPLLINDRLDVALAIGAEGVHIGQEDIDIATARKALGAKAIIGATASSVEEAVKAAHDGADYLGLGTTFATQTKQNTKSIVGPTGLRRMLRELGNLPAGVKRPATVCIGGINASNAQQVLFQSQAFLPDNKTVSLDGIAVVSAIVAASDPRKVASTLRAFVDKRNPAFATHTACMSAQEAIAAAPSLHKALANAKPLSHNMTNQVVQNIAANIALAIGASPIMSQNGAEASDLAAIPNAGLVINMGTANAEAMDNYKTALKAYNLAGRPTLLDPVGAGATALRRNAVRELLNAGYFSVIKGNEAEIRTVWTQGAGVQAFANENSPSAQADDVFGGSQQRGVDSGTSTLSSDQKAQLVSRLATRQRAVVLMTGATDYVSDGTQTFTVDNGHPLLGEITGSGCSLGTTVLSFVASDGAGSGEGNTLRAVLAALLVYEIAAERAASSESVRGPGTFVPAFIDDLYAIREQSVEGDEGWVKQAKVSEVHSPS